MQYFSAMHKSNALADLSHKHDAGFLRQDKVIIDYSLKQLSARDSINEERDVLRQNYTNLM
jgi:hypothetical protein